MTYQELLAFEPSVLQAIGDTTLDYPRRHGSAALSTAISDQYQRIGNDCVSITAGLDDGLAMLFHTLVQPGDRVVVLTPAYPPHLLLPETRQAEVIPWPARAENDWVPDLDELDELLDDRTRLVLVTFPQNPTGFMPDRAYVQSLIERVTATGALLISDEIYSWLPDASSTGVLNLCDLSDRVISMHGLSKAFGMPGLRVGWMVSQNQAVMTQIRAQCELFNCYVPPPVDHLATLALRHKDAILARNARIVQDNLTLANEFFARHDNLFRWRPPMAGALAFPRWLGPGGTRVLSDQLLASAALVLAPSYCFGVGDEHFRLSLSRRSLGDGLQRLEDYLSTAVKTQPV